MIKNRPQMIIKCLVFGFHFSFQQFSRLLDMKMRWNLKRFIKLCLFSNKSTSAFRKMFVKVTFFYLCKLFPMFFGSAAFQIAIHSLCSRPSSNFKFSKYLGDVRCSELKKKFKSHYKLISTFPANVAKTYITSVPEDQFT